jgi:hypothetical protein
VPLGVDPSNLLYVLSVVSFANVTAPFAIVVVIPVLPLPLTSPLNTMAWSPVFVPEDVPVKLVPVTLPVAATEDGVMAPRPNEMPGVVVDVATEAVMPLEGVTVTLVTVPTL